MVTNNCDQYAYSDACSDAWYLYFYLILIFFIIIKKSGIRFRIFSSLCVDEKSPSGNDEVFSLIASFGVLPAGEVGGVKEIVDEDEIVDTIESKLVSKHLSEERKTLFSDK